MLESLDAYAARRPLRDPELRSLGVQSFAFGLLPVFRDPTTGETHAAVNEDGSLSPIHLLDGLPDSWVAEHDDLGRPVALRADIIAGFLRAGRFLTCTELTHARPLDA